MKLKSTLSIICFLLAQLAIAQTNVPALITSNQSWTPSGSPYIIGQNTYIDSGVVVKIAPGTVVKSTNSLNKVLVDGTLQAIGTASSNIKMDNVQFEFTKNGEQYDPSTGKGARFEHCFFQGGLQSSTRAINSKAVDVSIRNCTFKHCFYGVYGIGSGADTLKMFIDSCNFIDSATRTYPLYFSGIGAQVTLTNSTVFGGSGIYLYGYSVVENCRFEGVRYYFNVNGEGEFHCNTFIGMRDGLEFRPNKKKPTLEFTNNTIDSYGASNTSPMLIFRNYTVGMDASNIKFNDNNFLYSPNPSRAKVVMQGSNSDPLTFDKIDFTSNYWGTTDTNLIDSFIHDYNDDITIFGKAIRSSHLSSKVKTCKRSTCRAGFYLAVDTSRKYNLYLVHNSIGTTPYTKYLWTFGDGDSSTKANPTHQYTKFGLYEVCLTISDTAKNCYSTYCDSVGLDSNGKLLKADGFTITVVNEDDLTSAKTIHNDISYNIYPNPSRGVVDLHLNARKNSDAQLIVYSIRGTEIVRRDWQVVAGDNHLELDLQHVKAGLYFVQLNTDNGSSTQRLILQNK